MGINIEAENVQAIRVDAATVRAMIIQGDLNVRDSITAPIISPDALIANNLSVVEAGADPIIVSSSIVSPNINAELLRGQQATKAAMTDTHAVRSGTSILSAAQFQSTATGGTPPLVVSSSAITNLNADLLQNSHRGEAANNIAFLNGTVLSAPVHQSLGTLACTSTVKVANLNAEYLDGLPSTSYTPTTHSHNKNQFQIGTYTLSAPDTSSSVVTTYAGLSDQHVLGIALVKPTSGNARTLNTWVSIDSNSLSGNGGNLSLSLRTAWGEPGPAFGAGTGNGRVVCYDLTTDETFSAGTTWDVYNAADDPNLVSPKFSGLTIASSAAIGEIDYNTAGTGASANRVYLKIPLTAIPASTDKFTTSGGTTVIAQASAEYESTGGQQVRVLFMDDEPLPAPP